MLNFKKIILNNGIPLYILNDPSLKQVFINYIVKYGSSGEWFKFNLDGKDHQVSSGHAHFLEHLLGEHSRYGNIYDNFTKRFHTYNTYTSMEHTSYNFYGINDIKQSVKELIEAVDMPVFDYRDVNHSKHAIEDEAATTSDDIKASLTVLAEKNLYGGFDLFDDSLSAIGDKRTTRKITTKDLRTCYDSFYSDDNKVLIIAGNINEQEIVDFLNEVYANIPRHKSNLILPKYDYESIRRKEDIVLTDIPIDYNALGIKVEKPEDVTDRELQFVLNVLLNALFADNEYMEEMKDKGVLDELQACYFSRCDRFANVIQGFISTKPDEYFKRVLELLNKKDIKKEDYELIRRILIAEEVRQLDSKYDALLSFGDKLPYTEDYSELDYYKEFNYDRFKDIVDRLNFDKNTKVKTITK